MENKPGENSLEDVLRWMDEDIDHAFERVLDPLEYGENEDATLIWQVVKDSERLLKQLSLQCAEMKEELESWKSAHQNLLEVKNKYIYELEQRVELLQIRDEKKDVLDSNLKEENERLKERIEGYEFGEQFKDSPFTSTSHLIKEVSELQEEVERLRSVLRKAERVITSAATEAQRTEIHRYLSGGYVEMIEAAAFKDSCGIQQALSGKESKTDNQ